MRRPAIIQALCIAALAATSVTAQDLSGLVESVLGTTVTIRIEGGLEPGVGDKVTLSDDVPDVGRVALRGTWRVTAVANGRVTAEAETPDAGAPQVGLHASIRTKGSRRKETGETPKPAPPKGEPAAKDRTEPAPKPEPAPRKPTRKAGPLPHPAKDAIAPEARARWGWHRGRGFALQLPPGYTDAPERGSIAFLHDTRNAPPPLRVVKVMTSIPNPPQTLEALRDHRTKDLVARFEKVQIRARGEGAKINFQPAVWLNYTYEWEGTLAEGIIYFVIKDGQVFEISFVSPADQIEAAINEYAEIFMTFRFE
jgi:hypothetical protein